MAFRKLNEEIVEIVGARYDKGEPLVITNTSGELMDWLRPWGGKFYFPRLRRSTVNKDQMTRPRFEWKVTRAWDIYLLLEALLPYLVIKRARAIEAMQDIRSRFSTPPGPGGQQRLL